MKGVQVSVPVGKRSENKLEVFQKARILVRHTCTLLVNEKHYPSRYDVIARQIIDDTWQVFTKSWRANNIFIGQGCNPNAIVRRRELQNECVELCESLLSQIEMFNYLCGRPVKKTVYWCGLVNDVLHLIRKWKDSDAKRVSKERHNESED